MAPGGVGADQHDQIGLLEILVAAGHDVLAEGADVPGDRRGHAQPRIGVDIGGADEALHQLVGDVVVLGQQLAGDVEGDRSPARARRWCRRSMPATRSSASSQLARCAADLGVQQPALERRASRRAPRPSSTAGRDWPDAPGRRAIVAVRRRRSQRRSRRRNRGRWCGYRPRSLMPLPARRASVAQDGSASRMRSPSSRTGTVGVQPSSGASASAAVQLDDPVVQRAGHRAAVHDALATAARPCAGSGRSARRSRRRRCGTRRSARRPASTRAARRGAGCRRARRSRSSSCGRSLARHRADLAPAARYSCAAAPAARSAQGRFWTKRCENRKRRCSARRPSASSTIAAADVVDADPRDPRRGALEIARLLAVELHERADIFEHLVLGRDPRQRIGDADLDPAIAADDGSRSRLSTQTTPTSLIVASAQLRGQPETASLTLCGRPRPPAHLLELDAEPGRILRAEAAPFGADAGLHRAQRLAVGVAGDEPGGVEVGPDRRQVLLLDAEQVDALAAGDLDGRDVEFLGDVGDRAQFARRWSARPTCAARPNRCRPSGCWRGRAR